MANKRKTNEVRIKPLLLQRIDEILFYEWDPIGINHNLQVRDEYAAYTGKICHLLQEGVEETALAHYLGKLANQAMGLSHVDEQRDRRVARRLFSAKECCQE
jgi:hypothetical protein